MLAARGPLETAIGRPFGGRFSLGASRGRRARLLAAILSTGVLGLALLAGLLTAGHTPVPTAGSAHASWGRSGLPLAARGPASAALGKDQAAYRVVGASGGLRALNPAQRLSARFAPGAVLVSSGEAQVGLSLRTVGYGSRLRALPPSAPHAKANRVLYRRGAVSEWYSNGPLGLEQGFSIASLPGGGGPLTLALALSGNVRASLSSAGGRSVLFSHAGSPVLRYGGLLATDARAHRLRSWLGLEGGQIRLHVDTRGARFPVRVDPWLTQAPASLHAKEGAALFGYSVALSGDGKTALIGGPRCNQHVGAAWVFVRTGETWAQQGTELLGERTAAGECGEEEGEPAQEEFGGSVALSGDGNTALIGAPREMGKSGAAWVFTRNSGTWGVAQRLTGLEESKEGRFGRSVALSADGNTALVGSSRDGSGHGAAWAFTRGPSEWTQLGKKLTITSPEELHFGRSVALSADGTTALIGGPGDAHYVGAAWVFTRTGESFTQQGEKLTGSGEVGEGHFGRSVALSGDGNTALIGGFADNERAGAAWAFAREGQSWAQQKLTGEGENGKGLFGVTVALSAAGNSAVIGGYADAGHVGAAWTFTRAGSWMPEEKLAGPATGETPWFGFSVALAGDGATALVGAPAEGKKSGGVWAFRNPSAYSPPTNTSPPEITGSGQAGQPLSCSPGTWTGNPPPTFTYEWQRDGATIAEGPTYVVQSADEGHTLTCVVTASNGVGSSGPPKALSHGLAIIGTSTPNPTPKGPGGSTTPTQGSGAVAGVKVVSTGLPAPIFGKTANLLPTAGLVLIKLPGSNRFVALSAGTSVPLGTIVDATRGRVQLISAADVGSQTQQSGVFYGGVFSIGQISGPSGVQGGKTVAITVLTLVGPPPSGCKAKRARRATVAAKRRTRKLWGNAKGNFTTSGRYASATVRGTQWLTEDTCRGTLIRVVSGVVNVTDLPHHRSLLLSAPKQFLAHPGRGG